MDIEVAVVQDIPPSTGTLPEVDRERGLSVAGWEKEMDASDSSLASLASDIFVVFTTSTVEVLLFVCDAGVERLLKLNRKNFMLLE